MALFIIGLPHPGDGITLHLVRGETGMLQVDVAESLGMWPIIVPAGEALHIANDGLQITLTREVCGATE